MNCLSKRVELFDLPDEMILAIIDRVKPEVLLLCSIVDMGNKRLEGLLLNKYQSIDLSFDYYYSPHDSLFERFYSNVIPRICYDIQSLTITLKHLLLIDVAVKATDVKSLPNLKHFKILGGARHHYTGTPYTISFHLDTENHKKPLFSTVPQLRYIEGGIIGPVLSIIRYSPIMYSINSFEFDPHAALYIPSNLKDILFSRSPYLTNVSVTLRQLEDCVSLLHEFGSRLISLTVSFVHVYLNGNENLPSEIKSIDSPSLKKLVMKIYRNILEYELCLLPLLQQLSKIEDLKLLLAVGVGARGIDYFIDGYHLEKEILSYMPHLRQFDYHIRSAVEDAPHIELDQIRLSLNQDKSNDCALDYFNNGYGQCQIYSLPFPGDRLDFISNRFPLFNDRKIFEHVTVLLLFDDLQPFEHRFFEHLKKALPFLRTLEIFNQIEQQQQQTNERTILIEYPHLSTLILHRIHRDYAEQLLYRSVLPCLVELIIRDDVLSTIINEDNQQARINCSHAERLFIVDPWIEPTEFHLKFFPKFNMESP